MWRDLISANGDANDRVKKRSLFVDTFLFLLRNSALFICGLFTSLFAFAQQSTIMNLVRNDYRARICFAYRNYVRKHNRPVIIQFGSAFRVTSAAH